MVEAKAVKAAHDAKPPSPKPASYVNVSDKILHLEAGVFEPGAEVQATQAELSNFFEYIKAK
jgi:hypothetical protein